VAEFSAWAAAWLAADPQARIQREVLAEGERLAQARRSTLKGLIRTDPRSALALTVPLQTRQQLPDSIRRHLEVQVSGAGSLNVLVADDFEHGTCEVSREVRIGGRSYEAFVYGRRLRDKCQTNVLLHGIAVDGAMAVAEDSAQHSPWAIGGDAGGVQGTETPEAASSWTQGSKTLLLMRVAFLDDPTEPITEPGAFAMLDQVDQFYLDNSYGTLAIIPEVTPLLILPRTKSAYGLLGKEVLREDAQAAALALGLDDAIYDLDIVIFRSIPGSGFAGWNGVAHIGAKGLWLQQTTSAGLAAHELGHNFGLWHANFWSASGDSMIGPGSTAEYGNTFDTMGSLPNGGIYQFNAEFKNELNWLPWPFVHTATNSGLYRLFAFDAPELISGQTYALRVNKDSARNYWVEFRQKFTSNAWLQNGVLLNWGPWNNTVTNSLNGTTLLDTTPGTPAGNSSKDDAAVVNGRTFADPGAGIYITPLAKGSDGGGNWIDVQVNLGVFTTNTDPSLELAVSETNVAVSAPVTFTAMAFDPNGDTLAYYWDFGDLTFGSNAPTASKSWSTASNYVVRCTVTDMKGGLCSRYVVITVGSPTTFKVEGRITLSGGQPLADVRVYNGLSGASYRGAYTDSDGYYTLANLTNFSYALSAVKYGYTLGPSGWSNPITVGPDASGVDWSATNRPIVSVSVPDPLAAEPNPAADTGTFTINRSGSLTSSLTLRFNLNGTATYPVDYTLAPTPSGSSYRQLTLAVGIASTNLLLTPLADAEVEGTETATLTLLEDGNYTLGSLAEATVSIVDKQAPPKPTVNLLADEDTVAESGPDSGLLRFTRDLIGASDLTINYSLSGTASNGVDYVALSGAATIPSGQTFALVPITAIDDLEVEGNETVIVTILANTAYQLGDSPSATVTINDDDPPRVFITATNNFLREGSSSTGIGKFIVTRFGSQAANLLVNYALSGTATNGIDYNTLSGSVLIPAGQAKATITVTSRQDVVQNGDRTVVATLLSNPAYNIATPGLATITIIDDDTAITLAVPQSIASEDGTSTGTFTFTRTGSTNNTLTVYFNIFGTAIIGVDYTAISNSIEIPAGTNRAYLVITALADSIREATETLVLTLQDLPEYSVSTTTPQTVSIIDNNSGGLPAVGFDTTAASGWEGMGEGLVIVSLSAASSVAVTVNYAVTGGTATSDYEDYDFSPGTLTFSPGQTNKSFTFFVTQDSLVEPDETIEFALSNPVNALLDIRSNFVFTIIDNDASGAVIVTAVAPNASEQGPVAGRFRISRSGSTTADLTVEYNASGTASSPSDYLSLSNSVIIPAGTNSVDILVNPVDDDTPEPAESVILTLASVSAGAYVGSPASATVWITDNDSTTNSPIVSLVTSAPIAWQGGDPGLFTVSRDRNTNQDLVISYSVGGTAVSGSDYLSLGVSVTIPAGASNATITVTPLEAGNAGSNVTVVPTLTSVGAYRIALGQASDTVTLLPIPEPTSGALTSSTNPALPAQPVIFTYTLSAATHTPTGAVQFKINGSNVGGLVLLNAGAASYTNAGLAHGTHTVAAEFSGNVSFIATTNQLSPSQVINTPPVAGADTIPRDPVRGVKILIATLLTNDTDADGDPITFVGASATSNNGGTVTNIGCWLFYGPLPGDTNVDAFAYAIGDSYVTVSNWVTVSVGLDAGSSSNLTITNLGNGSYAIYGDGVPNYTYRIQYADGAPGPDWLTLGPVTANPVGFFQFIDTNGAPLRYYRSAYP
jgi:hypothetical protein